MPRACTICTHPQREAIDKALVGSESFHVVSQRFGISAAALQRHRAKHIPALLAKAEHREERQTTIRATKLQHEVDRKDEEETTLAFSVRDELQRIFARINLLFDACDRWLRDPEDTSRYTVEPRAEDVKVVYTVDVDGKAVRRKERLSALLSRVECAGRSVESSEYKHADPRELILKTADSLQGQLELIAKLMGELDERPQVNVLISTEWIRIRSTVLQALLPYPDARTSVAAALLEAERAESSH